MPALNFQPRFAPLILDGTKRSTIRRRRKDRRDPKPGQTLYLFTGMRTKKCRRLTTRQCKETYPIRIRQTRAGSFTITVAGRPLSGWSFSLQYLWFREGFKSLRQMLDWFRENHGPRFSGLLIKW